TEITMPKVASSAQRRYIAGEKLHTIMMNARMASRPTSTLFEALLAAGTRYGMITPVIKDITSQEENYRQFLRKTIALSRLFSKITSLNERVGVLLPNAVVTGAAIFGLSLSQRTPCLLNYTAGIHGLHGAIQAAGIKTIIT